MKKLLSPFQGSFPITQNFGVKINYTRLGVHYGVDWAMPKGTPLFASIPGITRVYNSLTGYGKHIYIDGHDGKTSVLLAHCSQILVKNGIRVERGSLLALSGNSGFWIGKNGNHLHFGLSYDKKWFDPLPHIYPPEQFKEHHPIIDEENKEEQKNIPDPVLLYTVKKNDNLWKIAILHYGVGTEYTKIYEANRDSLSDPNVLPVGVNLKIPK